MSKNYNTYSTLKNCWPSPNDEKSQENFYVSYAIRYPLNNISSGNNKIFSSNQDKIKEKNINEPYGCMMECAYKDAMCRKQVDTSSCSEQSYDCEYACN